MTTVAKHTGEVLIVQENPDLSKELESRLIAKGYVVRVAHTGPAAIALAVTNRHHVVIVDLDLLDMDGMEVLRYLKEVDLGLMPIVLMNQPSSAVKQELIALGAFACLVKPCNVLELDALIDWAAKVKELSSERAEQSCVN